MANPTILIAPDSFKGSLSALQFCQITEQALKTKLPNATIVSRPLSDGGEGFAQTFIAAGLAESRKIWCSNPLGRKVKAEFGWIATQKTAIIEMAQAAGITLIQPEDLNPLQTHTLGVGQIIKAAIELGAETIILGLGGSATNDGGVGALQALDIDFFTKENQTAGLGGQALKNITRIGDIPTRLNSINWILACDVDNPLLGEHGATTVYGPQKGVTDKNQQQLEQGLGNLANLIEQKTGTKVAEQAGAGAAGGMAACFMGLLDAEMRPGFDIINEMLELDYLFEQKQFDYVITGEGKMDNQTAFGKLPLRIAQLAKQHQAKTIGVCGYLADSIDNFPEFDSIFSIIPYPTDQMTAMRFAPQFLDNTIKSVAGLLKSD